jgi:hypothetical protein
VRKKRLAGKKVKTLVSGSSVATIMRNISFQSRIITLLPAGERSDAI